MSLNYLLMLAIGIGIIWFGWHTKEEVIRLASAICGAIVLVWGFALTPLPLQLFAESMAVLAVFSICIRCWNS
jgi:membrane protein YdbS with pleckstrin-like domain